EAYEQRAESLLRALQSDDQAVAWRFKWEHPRFRGSDVSDVRSATLDLADARMVIAREHGFEDWSHLSAFVDAVASDPRVARFEAGVEAVVSGDLATLRALLSEHAELARA